MCKKDAQGAIVYESIGSHGLTNDQNFYCSSFLLAMIDIAREREPIRALRSALRTPLPDSAPQTICQQTQMRMFKKQLQRTTPMGATECEELPELTCARIGPCAIDPDFGYFHRTPPKFPCPRSQGILFSHNVLGGTQRLAEAIRSPARRSHWVRRLRARAQPHYSFALSYLDIHHGMGWCVVAHQTCSSCRHGLTAHA